MKHFSSLLTALAVLAMAFILFTPATDAGDCDLGTCSVVNGWFWSTQWSLSHSTGADKKGIAFPHETCQDFDSGSPAGNDAEGFLTYLYDNSLLDCDVCIRRFAYVDDDCVWEEICINSSNGNFSGNDNWPLEVGEGYEMRLDTGSSCTLDIDICGGTDPDFAYSDLGEWPFDDTNCYNIHGIALAPSANYDDSEDVLRDWWDGTNTLVLMKYDNSIPTSVLQGIEWYCSPSSCWTVMVGPTFDVERGESVWFQLTGDLTPTDYEFPVH